ncbi:unnamed protein product [Aphanomyces euteiches]|uniref:B box-type domain-containing protein n=1 Tax=Aphanomyces euteiches TaxID=100861 RepID=A0A6G0WJC2_9STRA|nr:hypothetical protein Ae201684_014603 [Aphanomyces euteiches]KAH9081119.1 hypothetical protein Ae201684P_012091 [Aphanomyces euteiches]KAH9155707.1 hypothetical protein AeRB84_002342 [Aphanomyces euteiches]
MAGVQAPPIKSGSSLRLLLSPHTADDQPSAQGAIDNSFDTGAGVVATSSDDSAGPSQVASVNSLNPLTKDFQRVRYLLQASLPGFRVHDDMTIWEMKNPMLENQYETHAAGLLELDSWVAVEDLGPSMAQMYSYSFTSLDTTQGMKFTTGNIVLDNPGQTGSRQYVLCKVATGRSLPIETEESAKTRLPSGFHSYYLTPKSPSESNYYHEYILTSTQQVLPRFLVRFDYSAIESKTQAICALCEKEHAAVACRSCEAELCATCDENVHSANKLAGRHKRTNLSQSSGGLAPAVPCRIHESKTVEFYCPACAIPVCVHCKMVGDHSCGDKGSHRLVSLAEAYDQGLKDSSKADPLVEARKQLIATKTKQIQERATDVRRNMSEVEAHIRSSLEIALARLADEGKAKLGILKCEELELARQIQQIEWTETFLASQRNVLAPVDFLAAWNQHKPLRAEQREFPVVHLASAECVKPDIQLLGRLVVVSGDDGPPEDILDKKDPVYSATTSGHVMSPKGKKIIEEVKNDLIKTAATSPQKLGQEIKKEGSTGRGGAISVGPRRPNGSVTDDCWSTQLRKEMAPTSDKAD